MYIPMHTFFPFLTLLYDTLPYYTPFLIYYIDTLSYGTIPYPVTGLFAQKPVPPGTIRPNDSLGRIRTNGKKVE